MCLSREEKINARSHHIIVKVHNVISWRRQFSLGRYVEEMCTLLGKRICLLNVVKCKFQYLFILT